ncbi:uncharacterized protein PGTG_05417 [Puccinia graminis f. sp. tritici CRL 75-36-700-3]|uniref:Phosphoglucomutase-3 n=1 Tax=Puccinia graminis f. sp. tritici (strain CRL 75-36-700-3 / race SCCL) TaxID=418459 RepID=E3K486_PUCGT|nr:uncharacterized protein PGTG_05417 [Puccinia graminis f. sp. tritici CRL 75-36-700-3]EFP79096.2 hypothetical protein PGTG_05417 [Puccinia graminis f. sp. tritici CRL 75-36-700-3]
MASSRSSVPLETLVQDWLRLDRNPTTRKEIEQLQQDKNHDELASRLCQRIKFGTAGLRAHMSAGFSRMNDVTVIQASQGLAAYLIKDIPNATQKGIIVGHDHRHNSHRFARLAVTAFLRRGFRCYLLDGSVATPMVPFGVKYLGAAAGVMVTASHNPAADNGYKLYYSNGVQIISPHDKGIAASIEQNLEIDEEAWSTEPTAQISEALLVNRTQEIQDAYFKAISGLVRHSKLENSKTPLKFIYTPMHGVGYPFATRACVDTAGFPSHAWLPVEAQKDPNPDFPTVKFPNPEEKGALDMAMSLGNKTVEADRAQKVMILANDPDADRFCAAEWTGSNWKTFSGDQIGAVFACWTLQNFKKLGTPLDRIAMLSSTVSSHLVAQIARQEGFKFKETLTGFKNIGNEALNLEKEGYKVLFAYEEALGYMFETGIFDKDGLASIVVWAELATELAQRGSSVAEYLENIYKTYGYFATNNGYFVCKDPSAVKAKFDSLRFGEQSEGKPDPSSRSMMLDQLRYPSALAGYPITRIRDLTIAYDDSYPPQCLPDLPSSSDEMITFYFGGEAGEVIATLRTSGTESWKLKYYVEGRAEDQLTAQKKVDQIVAALGEEWGFSNL